MNGGDLIREARRRAGITQRQLARRLGTSQPVVARWERGRRSPDYDTVSVAVRACGFVLRPELVPLDLQEEALLNRWLAMSPRERLEANQAMIDLEKLARHAKVLGRIRGDA